MAAFHKDHEAHDDHEDLFPICVTIVIIVIDPSVECGPLSLCNAFLDSPGSRQ
jgi:hypothetical protein